MILYLVQSSAYRFRWWLIVSKPPVPIPNTVVKTYRGKNTWRATSWEDSTLPASILKERRINRTVSSSFCFREVNHPSSRKTIHWIVLLGRVIPNTVVKTYRGENTWRATSREDSTLPASILKEKRNRLDNRFLFFVIKSVVMVCISAKPLWWWLNIIFSCD